MRVAKNNLWTKEKPQQTYTIGTYSLVITDPTTCPANQKDDFMVIFGSR